jgi:two-component system, NarL family, nitrate/nitrite response regulator NarL
MKPSEILRVLVVDDHDGFRHELCDALRREADFCVVREASTGADAIRRARELRPHGLDLVLMDISMPAMNGIEATARLTAFDPTLAVIILTVSTVDEDLFACLDSGAVGYLNKTLTPAALVRAIRDFRCTGALPMSRVVAGRAMSYLQKHRAKSTRSSTAPATLSEREREVLMRIAGGAHDREIARTLVVAETTVKTHVRHILHKLGARNRAEAVAHLR